MLWRPASIADLDDIWRLRQVMSRADHPDYLTTRESIEADFRHSYFDANRDSLVGLDSRRDVVAVGMVIAPPRAHSIAKSIPIGGVHPDFRNRGIGRELLRWQLDRAEEQLTGSGNCLPRWVLTYADDRAPQNARLFIRAGLQLARRFAALERPLSEPVEWVAARGGVAIRAYSPEWSSATHAARDAAFLDHWGGQPMSDESWASYVNSTRFAPGLSFVATAPDGTGGDQVIGFVLSSVTQHTGRTPRAAATFVDQIGVVREWRGNRIAQALLSAHLRAGKAAGFERATLVSDLEVGGALPLHTGMGFRATQRKAAFIRQL